MATIHLDASGSNTAPYDTWAKAATTWATAVGALAAGDDLVMSSSYTESTSGAVSWALPGTDTLPNRIMCGTKAATSGLSSIFPGAVLTATSGGAAVTGSAYIFGITFKSTSVTTISPQFNAGTSGHSQVYDQCTFDYGSANSAGNAVWFGSLSGFNESSTRLRECSFKLGNTGQTINLTGAVVIHDSQFLAGGSTPVTAFTPASGAGRPTSVRVYGLNFTALGTAVNVFATPVAGAVVDAIGLKMPAGWTGSFVHGSSSNVGGEINVVESDANAITSRALYKLTAAGSVVHETTIVRTGGATDDGSTTYSWKLVSESDCSIVNPLRTPRRAIWNATAGSPVTLTVEIENDGTTFTDKQVALWANYRNTSSMSSITSSPDAVTSASNLATSSQTWTTTGQTTPTKQNVSLTFTPGSAGPIEWWIELVAPSATVFVDPMVAVS